MGEVKATEPPTKRHGEAGVALGSNIVVTVAIVLINKKIFDEFEFPGAVTASAVNVTFGFALLSLLAGCGAFQPKSPPPGQSVRQASLWGLAIALDLLSLKFNSIGFFQISKCTTLPLAAVVNFVVVGELPSRRIMLCLAWLTVGIAVTTATDVQINPMGCVAAVLAVVSTVLNQVWAGQLMKTEGLTSVQYTHALSLYAGLLLTAVCVPLDYLATGVRIDRWLRDNVEVPLVVSLLVTSTLAALVNVTAYWCIQTTSAVTYQVSSQVKNAAIIFAGFVLFAYPIYAKNVVGILVALSGASAYTFTKLQEQEESTHRPAQVLPVVYDDSRGNAVDVRTPRRSSGNSHSPAPAR